MLIQEILDIYKYHNDPSKLKGHDTAYDQVPELAWQKLYDKFYDCDPESKNQSWIQEVRKQEHLWAQCPETAYNYACNILYDAFPEGEAAIATSPKYAYLYAKEVIINRFPEGEAAIATSSEYSYFYAQEVIKKGSRKKCRFPQGETIIATNPQWSYFYAINILQGRFLEGEAAISTVSKWKDAYERTMNVKL